MFSVVFGFFLFPRLMSSVLFDLFFFSSDFGLDWARLFRAANNLEYFSINTIRIPPLRRTVAPVCDSGMTMFPPSAADHATLSQRGSES
jgi:hypothetical protein